MLASDTVYLPEVDAYSTLRRGYRFDWDRMPAGVFQASVKETDIVSDARTDGEVFLGREANGEQPLLMSFDHERTVGEFNPDTTQGYHRFITPWHSVTASDFDGLMHRTDQFGRDLIAE